MAGYSGTPLVKKLGIKDAMPVLAIDAPPEFKKLLPGVKLVTSAKSPAMVHCFVRDAAALKKHLTKLRKSIPDDGVIWISWPKKASKVPTDVTEDVIRKIALPM